MWGPARPAGTEQPHVWGPARPAGTEQPHVWGPARPAGTDEGAALLTPEFFQVPAHTLARRLLGVHLVHGTRVGRIVEVEAYEGPGDAACHARFGLTKRTRALFGPPGHAYVYLIYGLHECFNVTALREGSGHAVLVRGIEPLWPTTLRTDGPGRVTKALEFGREYDGRALLGGPLRLEPGDRKVAAVGTSMRVGVGYAGADAEKPWRFFEQGNPHVSRPSKSQLGQRKAAEATTTTSVGTPALRTTRVPRRTQ